MKLKDRKAFASVAIGVAELDLWKLDEMLSRYFKCDVARTEILWLFIPILWAESGNSFDKSV